MIGWLASSFKLIDEIIHIAKNYQPSIPWSLRVRHPDSNAWCGYSSARSCTPQRRAISAAAR